MAADIKVIWVIGEEEYFWRWDWTGRIDLIPQGNFSSVIPGQ
jgi:hypothetical protein